MSTHDRGSHPVRYCNGGIGPGYTGRGCGAVATVVCTERGARPPLQWFACDQAEHQEGGSVEAIAGWFERLYADLDARERHRRGS